MASAREIRAVLAVLLSSYPRTTIRPEVIEAYTAMLADLDADALRAAATAHIAESQWWPTIAELRSRVAEMVVDLPSPESAWAEVQRAILSHGTAEWPTWSCPQIRAAVVEAGGWRTICLSPTLAASRRAFLDAYAMHRSQAVEAVQTTPVLEGRAQRLLGDGE